MDLTEILSAVSGLSEGDLRKVKKLAETILQDEDKDGSASRWPVFVWEEIGRQLRGHGLHLKPAGMLLRGKGGDRLASGADSLRSFLVGAMQTDDDLKLRLGLPLVIEAGIKRMQGQNMALVAPLIGSMLHNFPAYLVQAYPGIGSPRHFRTIWKLHKRSSVR